MKHGRKAVISVIQAILDQGHRITQILTVLKILKRTYYNWLHWRTSETTRHRYKLTRLIKQLCQQHPEYGYVRVAKRLRKNF